MRYKHDCENCQPLGEYGNADLYFCSQSGMPTVIARYSDKPEDYTSGLELSKFCNDLREARERAISSGYIAGHRPGKTLLQPVGALLANTL